MFKGKISKENKGISSTCIDAMGEAWHSNLRRTTVLG
jgi:hypothetical protein